MLLYNFAAYNCDFITPQYFVVSFWGEKKKNMSIMWHSLFTCSTFYFYNAAGRINQSSCDKDPLLRFRVWPGSASVDKRVHLELKLDQNMRSPTARPSKSSRAIDGWWMMLDSGRPQSCSLCQWENTAKKGNGTLLIQLIAKVGCDIPSLLVIYGRF